MKHFAAQALYSASILAFSLPAAAQSIDYGSLEQLFGEPVTTSATGKPQRASDAPVAMEIVTADQIRQTGAVNIPDVLQRVVGMDVAQWANNAYDVSVRGYNSAFSPRLLVLVNGRQVYLDHYGMTAWNAIPVEMGEIRQIEVVKGPNSALFGFNAVGGVVNIITYNPLYDNVNSVTVRGGTQKHREVSGVSTIKLGDKAGLRLSAGGFNAEMFDASSIEPRARSVLGDPMRRSASADFLMQLTDKSQVGLELTKVHSRGNVAVPSATFAHQDVDVWSAKGSYTASTALGLIEATLYHNVLDIDSNIASPSTSFNNSVTVARVQDLFKVGSDHSFRLSAEYRHNQLDSVPDKGGRISYDVYSAGGMWDWAISDKVSLVNAARIDHLRLKRSGTFTGPALFSNSDYDQQLTQPSFNSAIVYKATDIDSVRVSYARGVQVPSLAQYAYMNVLPSRVVYGNPYINPSIVSNYELGYDRAISAIDGAFRASVYYQANNDLVLTTKVGRLGSPNTLYVTNLGHSSLVGGELSLKGKIGTAWGWKAGYAFEKVKDDFSGQPLDFQASTPRHKVTAELTYADGPWEASVFAKYVSSIDMVSAYTASPVQVSNYLSLAARVGYQITDNAQLALTGFDIGHDKQRQTYGQAVERRVLLSLTTKF